MLLVSDPRTKHVTGLAAVTWCYLLHRGHRNCIPVLLSPFKLCCKKECGTSFFSAGRVLAIILCGWFLDTHSFV